MLAPASIALILALLPASFSGKPSGLPMPPDSLFLTLEEARALALSTSPMGRVIRAEGEAARGAARIDRTYPFNPTVEVKGVEALDPGGYGDYEAVLSQEIEWAGQWLVRRAAGGHASTAARLEEEDAIRNLLLEVDVGFFRLRAAEETHSVAIQGAALARTLRAAVETRAGEGAISTLEMNLTIMEAGRAEARGLSARNTLASARQALRDILGLEPDISIRTVEETAPSLEYLRGPFVVASEVDESRTPATSMEDALVERAMAHRPDLLAARAREDEAQSRRRLASMEAIPNVDVGAVVDRSGANADVTYGLRIAVPFPLWNRNQGERQQTRALEERAQAITNEIELRIRGEVLAALDAVRTATEELELFQATVLQPARENRQLLQRAFDLGRLDLPTVLLLQTQQVESEMAYWDSWLRQRAALARLEAALGGGA